MTSINEPRSIVMILFWVAESVITITLFVSSLGRVFLKRTKSPHVLAICNKMTLNDRSINRMALSGLVLPLVFCGFIFMDSVMSQAFREISRESQMAVLKSCLLGAIPIVAVGFIPFVIGRRLVRRK